MTATVGTMATWAAIVAFGTAGGLAVADRSALGLLVNRLAVGLSLLAVSCLGWALATGDFTLAYVAAVTDRSTSWPYRLAGLWGGMGGSLLVWSALVGVWGWRRTIGGVERAAAAWLAAGLLLVDVTLATPWHRLAAPALDGLGATPILRHPAMLYHPPILYLGLTALLVPWAATVAAGIERRPLPLRQLRRQLLACLGVLTLGITAGAHWAYVELGWGGFWAWDPVENTALLPWLAVLGALHGLAGDRRHGATAGGMAAPTLTSAALALAVLGTMLTRSGAAPSVHAFGEDAAVGRALVALTGVVVAVSVLAVVRLAAGLRAVGPASPPGWAPPPGSAGAQWGERWALRAQPWLAGFAVLVVLLGTVRPLVGSDDVAVDGSYYSSILAPVGLLAVVLAVRFLPVHLAHLGLVLLAVGFAASTQARSATATLAVGDSLRVGGWEAEHAGVAVIGERTVGATVVLRRGGEVVATLEPSLVAFPERGVLLAETSLRSTPLTDVQVALRDAGDDGRALLEVHVRPLVWCIWWGGLLLAFAALRAAARSTTADSSSGDRFRRAPRPRSPEGHGARVPVAAQTVVLGDQPGAVLDGGGVDQAVGRVAEERLGQPHRGLRDRWRDPERAHLLGE